MNDDSLNPVEIKYTPDAKHKTAGRQFQGIPGVAMSPGGCLFATWYSGGVNEGPENFAVLVQSSDLGRTWSEPVAVIDPAGRNIRAFDPALWLDPQGRLWWFWAQSFSPKDGTISDGANGLWAIFTADPDDEILKWSEPVRIADGIMMNKPTVLADGTWALPSAIWGDGIGGGKVPDRLAAQCGANMVVSTDNGQTFSYRGGAAVPHRCFDEHMIVELKNGRLWMLVRTFYGIGQSFSSDQGRTWTPGENSGLGGPNSRFFIRRLSSGNLILVNHADISSEAAVKLYIDGNSWHKRSHLTAFISDDDGKAWKGGLLLDERDNVSYPDGVEDKDGVIRIIYDYERYKEGSIFMAAFKEEDVLAGKCVTAQAELKILVNKTGGIRA